MPKAKRDEPERREFPGGDDSTESWRDKDSQFGEKFGDNLGFGREGEHVEPQPYGGPPPQGTEVIERYAMPENSNFVLESGPKTGLGPKNCGSPTGMLIDDVCVQLTQNGHLDASQLEVAVEESVVFLRGSVKSAEEKQIAEQVVRSIGAVMDVRNEIQVKAD